MQLLILFMSALLSMQPIPMQLGMPPREIKAPGGYVYLANRKTRRLYKRMNN